MGNNTAVRIFFAHNECVADRVQNMVHAEHPRARRYPFVASVELVDLQSELQFQGRATDLSLYGCVWPQASLSPLEPN